MIKGKGLLDYINLVSPKKYEKNDKNNVASYNWLFKSFKIRMFNIFKIILSWIDGITNWK